MRGVDVKFINPTVSEHFTMVRIIELLYDKKKVN